MATKHDVKRLLKSPDLTGAEAARLMVQHFLDYDHGRGKLLTEPQIERLKRIVSHRPVEEVATYNAILEAYRVAEFTLREAHITALEIQVDLERALRKLRQVSQAWLLRSEQHRRPAVLSAKQYETLKARQRERKLGELCCLNQVIAYRASGIVRPGERLALERLSPEDLKAVLLQARQEIEELIAGGKLQPVELEARADDERIAQVTLQPPAGLEKVHYWPPDEHRFPSGTPQEEVERQLRTYLCGEELYQADLPEWRHEVDTYRHEEEAEFLPEALRSGNVAVLQEPVQWPVELDARGYYRPQDLVDASGLPAVERSLLQDGWTLKEHLREQHRLLRRKLRLFLAHRPVFEALSALIGVKLYEDLETWQAEIDASVTSYANLLELPSSVSVSEEERGKWETNWQDRRPEMPPFTLKDLQPDPHRVQQLKERLSLPLGDAWWEWLEEEFGLIDAEEDKPAEEERPDGE